MNKMMKFSSKGKVILWVICLLIIGADCYATDVNCSSSSTVQTALNGAVSGDTIRCSSVGTFSWGNVSVPATKNITLDGNGATVSGSINIPSSASYTARVTNFTFTSTGAIKTGDGYTNTPWRVDHCTFTGSGTVFDAGSGPGLIDHCNFTGLDTAQETVHIWGWNAGSTSGWTNAHAPGSPNAIYFENNTVSGAQGNSTCLFQTYYGGRVVARYNTINTAMFDVHGNTAYSGRWWEFYNNTWTGSSDTMCLRGGSGIIFGNTGSGSIFFTEEKGAGTDQVGRGQNFTVYPAYIWNNGSFSTSFNSTGCAPPAGNYIQLNTDVFVPSTGTSLPATCTVGQGYWKTDEGGNWDTTNSTDNDGMLYKCTSTNTWTAYYRPYTYPHPLTNGIVTGTTKPNPPSAVVAL